MPSFRFTAKVSPTAGPIHTRVVVVGSTMMCLRRALLAQLEDTGVRSATVGTYTWPLENCPVAFDGDFAPPAVVAVALQGTATTIDKAVDAVRHLAMENQYPVIAFVPHPSSRYSVDLPSGLHIVAGDLAASSLRPRSNSRIAVPPLRQFAFPIDWIFVSILVGLGACILYRDTLRLQKLTETVLVAAGSAVTQFSRFNHLQLHGIHIWLNPYLGLPGEPPTRYEPDNKRITLWRPWSLRPGAIHRALEGMLTPDARWRVFLVYQVYEDNGVVKCCEIAHFAQLQLGRPLYFFTVNAVCAAARFLSAFEDGNQALARRYLVAYYG